MSEKIAARRLTLSECLGRALSIALRAIDSSLPIASRAVSQPTGAMGINTWALFKRTLIYLDIYRKYAGAQSTKEPVKCMENQNDWKRRWKAHLRAR